MTNTLTQSSVPQLILKMVTSSAFTNVVLLGHFLRHLLTDYFLTALNQLSLLMLMSPHFSYSYVPPNSTLDTQTDASHLELDN